MSIRRRLSPNCDARPAAARPRLLIFHYTGMKTEEAALAQLCNASSRVSAHYFVSAQGEVWQLVADEQRAWHAGESFWDGIKDVNGHSLGIEIANPGHQFGYTPFPEAQMTAVENLAAMLVRRYQIAPRYVLGHSDVAPERKQDPGEKFNWPRLARAGIGLWHPPEPPSAPLANSNPAPLRARLAAFGYRVEQGREHIALTAFQRHFRPERVDGLMDQSSLNQLESILRAAKIHLDEL